MPHCVTDPSEGCWLTVVECSECSGSTNKCLWCSTVHSFSVVGPISPPCFIINLHIICITCRCSSSNDVVTVCVLYAGKNQFDLSQSMKTSSSSSTSLDLGVSDGHEVVVADATTPKPISLVVKYTQKME